MSASSQSEAQLGHAYATCRAVARSAAKNFYYSFLALPKDRRNAMCAVYAFMRHADDLADSPGFSIEQRREKLDSWMAQARHAFAGELTDDAILLALADTQKRFNIPQELFEKLVQGTAMDLDFSAPEPEFQGPIAPYRSFEELYQYCYHVASVVGLVCIRIFGYRDPAAEALAEKCGVAFQLTNIIRDVKEDAAMGRIYLPREDMENFGLSPLNLSASLLGNGFEPGAFKPLLEFEARRALALYDSGRELLPLVDPESRPALWVLLEIYSRLLKKIAASNYDVFSRSVRLSRAEKIVVLSRGLARRLTA